MIRLLVAELLKARTLPLVWVTGVLVVGGGPVVARAQRTWMTGEPALAVLRVVPGYLVLGPVVLGVFVVCSEYTSSQILTTVLAAPRRGALLTSKMVAIAVVAAGVSLIALVGSRLTLTRGPWTAAEVRFIAVVALVHGCLSIMCAAWSIVIRHLVGSVVTACSILLVAPMLVGPWPRVARWLPDALASELYGGLPRELPSPRAGLALAAWVCGSLLLAAVRFLRTDA